MCHVSSWPTPGRSDSGPPPPPPPPPPDPDSTPSHYRNEVFNILGQLSSRMVTLIIEKLMRKWSSTSRNSISIGLSESLSSW